LNRPRISEVPAVPPYETPEPTSARTHTLNDHPFPPRSPAGGPEDSGRKPIKRRKLGWRIAGYAAAALGTTVTFALATVGSTVMHVGLPAVRRVAAATVTDILASSFQGRIVIEGMDTLRLNRIEGLRGAIYAPAADGGQEVVSIAGGHAKVGLYQLLASLVSSKGPLVIPVKELTIDHAEVKLVTRADGSLTLAHAFDPKDTTTPAKPSTPGRGIDLEFPDVVLKHAWIHGTMAGQAIDADIADLGASARIAPDAITAALAHSHITARALVPVPVYVDAKAKFAMPVLSAAELKADPNRKAPITVDGDVDASAGEVKAVIHGSMDGDKIAATVDVPKTQPGAIQVLVPNAPVYEEVDAHVDVKGTMQHLVAIVHADAGKGSVDIHGSADLGKTIRADADIALAHIDIGAFSKGTPSDLNTDVKVEATVDTAHGTAVAGTFTVDNEPGSVVGQAVPAAQLAGNFTQSMVNARGKIFEPGAPTEIAVKIEPKPGQTRPSLATFDVKSSVGNLAALRRVPNIGSGSARVHAAGTADIDSKTMDVRAEVDGQNLAVAGGAATIGHASVNVAAKGAFTNPQVQAQVRAETVGASGYAFDRVQVDVGGGLESAHIAAEADGAKGDKIPMPTVKVNGDLGVKHGVLEARDVKLGLSRDAVVTQSRIGHIRVAGGNIDVEGFHLEGLGKPLDADVHKHGNSIAVKLHEDELDLDKVATLANLKSGVPTGHLALDVDLAETRDGGAIGHARFAGTDLQYEQYPTVATKVDVEIAGHDLSSTVSAKAEGIATVDVQATDVRLRGGLMDGATWKNAVGKVDVESNVVLAKVAALVPDPDSLPVSHVGGVAHIFVSAARARPGAIPDVAFGTWTRALYVAGAKPKIDARATPEQKRAARALPPPWESRGMDIHLRAGIDGDENEIRLRGQLLDPLGEFANIAAHTNLPLKKLVSDPMSIADALPTAPFKAHVDLPKRKLGKYPTIVPHLPVAGEIAVQLNASGTMRQPQVDVKVQGHDLHASGDFHKRRDPLDLNVELAADEKSVKLVADAVSGKKLVLHSETDATLTTLLGQVEQGAPLAWNADSHTQLTEFPMDIIPSGMDKAFAGTISGNVDLGGLNKDANLKVALTTSTVNLGKTRLFDKGNIQATIAGGKLASDVRFDQAKGFVEAKANGAMDWGAAMAPSINKQSALDAQLAANNFNLAGVAPFADSAVNDLTGTLNANAKVHLTPDPSGVTMDGSVVLTNAGMEVPAIGEELNHVQAKISMHPDGTIKLENLEADPATGHVKITGEAKMAGLDFKSAKAHIAIKNGQEIPIAVQGSELGDAWGNIDATVTNSPKLMNVDVSIPQLHMHLPQSTGHSVEALPGDPTIDIGYRESDGKLGLVELVPPKKVSAPSDKETKIAVHLGRDVYIARDTTLKIEVNGDPTIDMKGNAMTMKGQLVLPGGPGSFLEVNGKRFEVDHGTVTFSGAADNPVIAVSAHWDASDSDKTRVIAEFLGPLKTGRIILRSEPSLTENEILSLVLFGSSDASLGSGGDANSGAGGDTAKGVGAAGGAATQAINSAISGFTGDSVTTRVDTSESDNPRPDVGWQISHSLAAHFVVNLGLPAPGDNPDQEILLVDWRFIRNWMLESQVGDAGSMLYDISWRFRY
jgi:translocation and assembly module TamB